jgi:hypothetical protein
MVWDVGTWQPLSPVPVNGKYLPGTDKEAAAMLAKGDLKFRLTGKRLKGDFALVHIKGRSGSKGNEWLLIKKKEDDVVADLTSTRMTLPSLPTARWRRSAAMQAPRNGRAAAKPRAAK